MCVLLVSAWVFFLGTPVSCSGSKTCMFRYSRLEIGERVSGVYTLQWIDNLFMDCSLVALEVPTMTLQYKDNGLSDLKEVE